MTFDEEIHELIGYYTSRIIPSDQIFPSEEALDFGISIKALIKKHQPEKLIKPSRHGKLYCPYCAKESMIHFPTIADDYNQALADSDKAYNL